MSATVHVVARKKLSCSELELIDAHNALVDSTIPSPPQLLERLRGILGIEPKYGWDERIEIKSEYVELYVEGQGRPEYDDGMILDLADLPTGTTALRIYMS